MYELSNETDRKAVQDALELDAWLLPELSGQLGAPNILSDWREAVGHKIGLRTTNTGTQNASSLQGFLTDRSELGGKLIIENDYETDPISVTDFDASAVIEFRPGAKLTGSEDFYTPVLSLRAPFVKTGRRTLLLVDPNIDCSHGSRVPEGAQPSAINVANFDELNILYPQLYGGEGHTNSNADSGIEDINCRKTLIFGGHIKGFGDSGWYSTGDNNDTSESAEDGISHRVIGTLFERCGAGTSAKRGLSHFSSEFCTYLLCHVGNSAVFVPAPQQPYPAKRMDLIGNRYKFIGARAFDYHGGSTGKIHGNTIEDFGFWEDGETAVTGAVAGLFSGARGVDLRDNRVLLKDWALSDQRGFVTTNVTENGTSYTGGAHTFAGNRYKGLARAVVEGSGTDPSAFGHEFVESISNSPPFSLLTNTTVRYSIVGDGSRYIQKGSNVTKEGGEQIIFFGTGTYLSAFGSVAAATLATPITISVPGAVNGDLVTLTPNTSGAANARLQVVARALTDGVQFGVYNGNGSAVDFTSFSYTLKVTRPA